MTFTADAPDRWEEELRAITEAVLSAPPPPPAQTVPAKPPSRQKTQYSATTGEQGHSGEHYFEYNIIFRTPSIKSFDLNLGRLIPPPSRAMSRGASRSQKRDQVMNSMAAQFLGADPQPEAKVSQFSMLLYACVATSDARFEMFVTAICMVEHGI